MITADQLERSYRTGELVGWAEATHPGLAAEQFALVVARGVVLPTFAVSGKTVPTAGKKMFLYHAVRKLLGSDTPNYPQEIGDCFIAGTAVAMADGTEKCIEDVAVGDVVLNHLGRPRAVTDLVRKDHHGELVTVWPAGGRRALTATSTHGGLFLTGRPHEHNFDRKSFGEYRTGDLLCAWEGGAMATAPVERVARVRVAGHPVFCVTVEGEHTLVANGISTRNCVSFGAKNATEYLQCVEKVVKGESQQFRPVFPPFYYGTGRTYVGGGRLGNSDGSLGSWMAEAVQKYGTLWADDEGVPKYSGRVAKAWGDPRPSDDLDRFKDKAAPYRVRKAALVTTWDQLVEAICNGYPCTTASNVGYSMTPSSDGFHRQTDNWPHQMCIIGVDDNDRDPYALILNSWGDAHGRLKDFETGEDIPVGVIRARRKDIEKHLRARETFAFGDVDGFPERRLDIALFDLIRRPD